MRGLLLAAGLLLAVLSGACAAEVKVAVAANFTAAAEELGAAFKAKTGVDVTLSSGATGALYTQISQGAPFEVFLSADNKRPAQSIAEGLGVENTAFPYAVGKLVLFSPALDVSAGEEVLKAGAFQHIAIADPASAPYGAAGVAAMRALGVDAALQGKLVTGESVTQTLQFIDSGNAELGFVALSQVIGRDDGQWWEVPQALYPSIVQDAVLLKRGENSGAAKAFLSFLRSAEGREIIVRNGYAVP